MYVVRRPFKCFGKCFIPGDVITDVTLVKGFKSKLVDRKIIEVTEHDYESMKNYFKQKFGVDLPAINAATSTEKPVATTVKLAEKPKQTNETPKKETFVAAKVAQPAKVVQPAKVQAAKVSK